MLTVPAWVEGNVALVTDAGRHPCVRGVQRGRARPDHRRCLGRVVPGQLGLALTTETVIPVDAGMLISAPMSVGQWQHPA